MIKGKYRQLMKTNEWTHEEMSLKVQVNQKKPKKIGKNTGKYMLEDVVVTRWYVRMFWRR